MFDLKKIDFIRTDLEHGRRHYSFVGLQRNKTDSDRLEFWLPLGFDDFNLNANFEITKSFFFKMYRTLKVYMLRKPADLSEDERKNDRDGIHEFRNGFSFANQLEQQPVFYGKLNAIDKILEGYDELKISVLEKKHSKTSDIDLTQIHRYLHQATYLESDIIYIDEMTIAKNVLSHNSPPILQLFSFIFTEIKRELGETENVPEKAFELSDSFKLKYLQTESSLFDEFTFTETLESLRAQLDEIERETTYKDDDFWHFYDAIESFLYGEKTDDSDGIFWGISNFYDVWEDMCQAYVIQSNLKPYILFADMNSRLSNLFNIQRNPFKVRNNNIEQYRMLRPDLVLLEENPVVDFKHFFEKIYYKKSVNVENTTSEGSREELILKIKSRDYDDIDELRVRLINTYNRNPKDPNRYENVRKVDFDDSTRGFKLREKMFKHLLTRDISELLDRRPIVLEGLKFNVIDYKYMKSTDYKNYRESIVDENGENKIKDDIQKQLIYEWTLQQNFEGSQTRSEFWIPYYSEDLNFEQSKKIMEFLSEDFKQSQIDVCKVNFKVLQEYYITLYSV